MYGKLTQLVTALMARLPGPARTKILESVGGAARVGLSSTRSLVQYIKANPGTFISMVLNVATLGNIGYKLLQDKDKEIEAALDEADPSGELSARYRLIRGSHNHWGTGPGPDAPWKDLGIGPVPVAPIDGSAVLISEGGRAPVDQMSVELHDHIQWCKQFFGNSKDTIREAHRQMALFTRLRPETLEQGLFEYFYSRRPVQKRVG